MLHWAHKDRPETSAKVDLPQPGWTWDDFHAAAKAISDWGKSKGIYGAALTFAENQSTYYNTIPQAGGEFIKEGKSGFGMPEATRGLQRLADWTADGSLAPVDVVTDLKANNMFKTGKAAMFWCGDWHLADFIEAFEGKEDDYDVIDLPKDKQQATVIHGLSWAVSKKSKNKAAAKALAAWMGTKESAKVEANNGTAIPAFNDTQEDWIVRALDLLETPWGIVLPGLFSAFGVFLMRQSFMNLPYELEEAARLDGCNPWQTFWKVMFPLVSPGLFAVAITTTLWSWNDLLWPLIVTTREESMPLSVGIATLSGQRSSEYALMMAASVMAMAPIFVLFFTMQKRVIEGLATSGLKG